MTEIDLYISVLLKFLAASILLERVLEFFDKIFTLIGIGAGRKTQLLRLADIRLDEEKESKRVLKKMIIMQTIGIIAGIGICYVSGLGILKELKLIGSAGVRWWDIVLSGILISGGSEPIHQLINFLKGHKDQLSQRALEIRQKAFTKTSDQRRLPGHSIGIVYQGGLYPDRPGHGLRKINPKFIVIHHSGTSPGASFEDVVKKEKQERTNVRGSYTLDPSFHSVITFDGEYHHYCRWDSVGWHVAKGPRVSNVNSLGLCFVGNFQIRLSNNPNGKNRPSEEQIETGAKLIALWRILYDIEEQNIVPHSAVRRGRIICPGENFPLERLIAKSTQLIREWKKNPKIMADIERFKKQRFIYV